MLASIALFNDSFANIVTITFSALVILELANVYSAITHLTILQVVASLFTLILYVCSIVFLP